PAVPAVPAQEAAEVPAGFTVVRAEGLPATPPAVLPGATASDAPTAQVVAATPAPVATSTAPAAEPQVDVPAAELPGVAAATVTSAAVAGAVPAAAGDTGAPDTGAPTAPTTAVSAAGVAAGGEAQSSGAGSSSQRGTADGGATQSAAPVVPSVSPTPAVPVVAPAGDSDGATGAPAAQPVGTQVARQVAVLRGGPDGAHTMTLVLTPDTLGPVEVQVTLQKGAVDLTLRGAHEQGRAALLDALPDLRRDLEAAGLSCSSLEVDRDSGGAWLDRHSAQQQAAAQQQGFGDRGSQQDRAEGRSRPWVGSADTRSSGPTPPPNRSTSSGVDVRV
ncbi:MAG: Flagellar hook-length control protein, partial [Blastococcus sp.]|nr:Flagellar hook-length control protein [Blastococcus sp.]